MQSARARLLHDVERMFETTQSSLTLRFLIVRCSPGAHRAIRSSAARNSRSAREVRDATDVRRQDHVGFRRHERAQLSIAQLLRQFAL